MFKSRRTPLKFHPVTERLVQYKKMLDQMDASDVDRSVMDQVRKVRSQMEEEGKSIDELVKRARKRAKAEEDKKTRYCRNLYWIIFF
jgi:CRISPR/Cas system-associated protein Csm6